MRINIAKFGRAPEVAIVESGLTYAEVFELLLADDTFSGQFQKFVNGRPLSEVSNQIAEEGANLVLVPKIESGN